MNVFKVVYDITKNRYFKSNPGGWEDGYLKAGRIVWVKKPEQAAKYAFYKPNYQGDNKDAELCVVESLLKVFPDHEFKVMTVTVVTSISVTETN